MTVEIIRGVLEWIMPVINFFAVATIAFTCAYDKMYRLHGKWFKNLSMESFDAIHYAVMAFLKLSLRLAI